MNANSRMTALSVTSIEGYAGDRFEHGSEHLPNFAEHLASSIGVPHTNVGNASFHPTERWEDSLVLSRPTLDLASRIVTSQIDSGEPPLIVMSRCATAMATIPKVLLRYPEAAVVWFDAHGDLNTPETTTTDYLGGLALSAILGEWNSGYGDGLKADRLVLIGARDLDPSESTFIEEKMICAITNPQTEHDFTRIAEVVKNRPVYVHFDLDAFDPSVVSAEFSVPNGLTVTVVKKVLETLAKNGQIVGLEIAEFHSSNNKTTINSASVIAELLNGFLEPNN